MLQNITFENIKADAENLTLAENDSYIQTYSEFIKYFKNINLIEKFWPIPGWPEDWKEKLWRN